MRRELYYDNLKGFLIICVVFWHTLSNIFGYYNTDYSYFKFFFFFMMVLFVFISGKFAKISRRTPLQRSLKMFLIFIIAQIIITLYYGYILKIIDPTKNLLSPRYTLWYLLTTASLYLTEYIFRKFGFKKSFIISLIISLGSGFISFITNNLSLTRTLCLLPFFILGYYADEIKLFDFIKKYKNIIFICTTILLIWFLFNKDFFLAKDMYFKYNYFAYRTPIECFLKRCLLYTFDFLFSFSILNIIPKHKTLLSNLGSKTLIIFLLHGVILKTLMYFPKILNNSWLYIIYITIMILLVCSLIDCIYKKIVVKLNKNNIIKQNI